MKKQLAVFTTVFAFVSLLSGCLVPERFSAKVNVEQDASYRFQFSGTALHAFAAAQIKQTGSLSTKDQNGLKAEADKLSKSPEVLKAIYKGNGRYELEIDSKKKAGQSLSMLDLFYVRTDKDGVMTISSIELKDKDKRELEKLGITIDGTMEVSLPKNADVISHNATSTPTFGFFGTYSWKIGRIDQRPMMKLKFKS